MFEELLKLVGDNTDAVALIQSLGKTIEKDKETAASTIQSLTSQFETIKAEKEKYKAGNALVKEALGLSTINDETVSARLKELGSSDSAKELAKKLSEKETEIESIQRDAEAKITDYRISAEADTALNAISETLSDDPILRNVFKDQLRKSIGVNDGQVLPMQTVGDQQIPIMSDGKPLSLSEYAQQMISGDEYKSFRKASVKPGGGSTGGTGDGNEKANFGGNTSEMEAAVEQMMNRR